MSATCRCHGISGVPSAAATSAARDPSDGRSVRAVLHRGRHSKTADPLVERVASIVVTYHALRQLRHRRPQLPGHSSRRQASTLIQRPRQSQRSLRQIRQTHRKLRNLPDSPGGRQFNATTTPAPPRWCLPGKIREVYKRVVRRVSQKNRRPSLRISAGQRLVALTLKLRSKVLPVLAVPDGEPCPDGMVGTVHPLRARGWLRGAGWLCHQARLARGFGVVLPAPRLVLHRLPHTGQGWWCAGRRLARSSRR